MSYICPFFFNFHFHYDKSYSLSLKQTRLFFSTFLNMPYYFWIITWSKKANDFQIVKVQFNPFQHRLKTSQMLWFYNVFMGIEIELWLEMG